MSRSSKRNAKQRQEREADPVEPPAELQLLLEPPTVEPTVDSRYIPTEVRRELRREVGFGCPVPSCGNPYLTYHHFDPPWAEEHHNDPERMIALCLNHHSQERAWTKEDFRTMKKADHNRAEVGGRFEWMKRDILTIVGGTFCYQNGIEIAHHHAGNVLWYTRDDEGRMLLNLRMLHTAQSVGTVILDENDWTVFGTPSDLESPPKGSYLKVAFPGGDQLSINFTQHDDPKVLSRMYGRLESELRGEYPFPLVTAEITMEVGGTGLRFGRTSTHLPGGGRMTGVTLRRNGVGLML